MNPESAWRHLRGLTPLSLCDWPGMPCPPCHNATLAWDMEAEPLLPLARLKAFLASRARWLSGVTVSGGEPTAVPGIGMILHEISSCGLPIKLDTNAMRPDVVEALLAEGLVELFSVDVKGPFGQYPALSGGAVSEHDARRNLSRLFALAEKRPEAFLFRTTRVPQLSETDITTVRGMLPAGFTLATQDYKPPRRPHALADSEARRTAGNMVQ